MAFYLLLLIPIHSNPMIWYYVPLLSLTFMFILLVLNGLAFRAKNFILVLSSYIFICQADVFLFSIIDLTPLRIPPLISDIMIGTISLFLFRYFCPLCASRGLAVESENRTTFLLIQSLFALLNVGLVGSTGNIIALSNDTFYNNALHFSVSALSLLVSFSGFMLFFLFQSNQRYRQIQELQKQLYQAQQDYMTQVLSRDSILRSFRHDVRGHLISLRYLLEQKRIEDAVHYMDEIDHSLATPESKYHTQNPIADALLSAKENDLQQHHIHCTVKGTVPPNAPLTDFDLCLLLSNLLDNAIEVNLRLPTGAEKYILLEIGHTANIFSMRLQNPIQKISDLKTKKREKEFHGIGLKNIAACTDRYHGTCEISQRENIFTIEVIFPIPTAENRQ